MNVWNILGIVAIVCLLATFKIGRNAIWGSLTIGAIGGLIYCLFADFSPYKKILIVSVLAGAFFELIGRLTSYFRKRSLESSIRRKVEKDIDSHYNIRS